MSELLGREAKYSFVDEWEPPEHKWSFKSEYNDWDEFFEKHSEGLFQVLLFFGAPILQILVESNLIEKFWYRIDVQNSITRNVLLLCEPKEAPEHNYYQEYVQKNFVNQLYIQIPNTINKMRRNLDDTCRKEQIRRDQGIRSSGGF